MAIAVYDLTVGYDARPVIERFSHRFSPGAVTCVMGPSGCGKTTLLHTLLGLVAPRGGKIEGLAGLRAAAVFQEDRLCENFSPVSNVRLVRKLERADIARALTEAGLGDALSRPVRELSGGMKRRVAIVRALLAESDVLFLDEPFKGLDHDTRREMAAMVLRHARGKTVVMVTHDPDEAALMNAEVVYLPVCA